MVAKSPTGFLDPVLIPWLPEAGIPGLYAKTLARDEVTGSYTRLLKLQPGTDTSDAGVQSHDHLEELWLVSGALHDLSLDQTFTKGMYANRLYHMDHGPWKAPLGAVTFELRDRDPRHVLRKPQREFVDPELLPWDRVDMAAGVAVKTLASCPDTGSYGRLVRIGPGASTSATRHGEVGRSEVWVIAGVLEDRSSGTRHPAGTYGNADLDLLDGRWTSSVGCLVFEVRNHIPPDI